MDLVNKNNKKGVDAMQDSDKRLIDAIKMCNYAQIIRKPHFGFADYPLQVFLFEFCFTVEQFNYFISHSAVTQIKD